MTDSIDGRVSGISALSEQRYAKAMRTSVGERGEEQRKRRLRIEHHGGLKMTNGDRASPWRVCGIIGRLEPRKHSRSEIASYRSV